MRKITKNERKMLVILGLVVIVFLYVVYMLLPHIDEYESNSLKLENLKTDYAEKKMLVDQKDTLIKTLKEDFNRLDKYKEEYFPFLKQEDFIVLLNSYKEDLDLDIKSFEFQFDNVNEDELEYNNLEITINFSGLGEALYSYIDKLNDEDKYIYVDQLEINNIENGKLEGHIVANFASIPALAYDDNFYSYFGENNSIVEKQATDPFVPYDSLAAKLSDDQEADKVDIYLKDRDIFPIKEFNQSSPFFVGNDPSIVGEVEVSYKRLFGNSAFRFDYDYGYKRNDLEANLVFDNSSNMIIYEEREFVSVWVYTESITGHEVGIVLVDSNGQRHRIKLSPNVNWKEWKVLEASMPLEIEYPCRIERLYVSSSDYDKKVKGSLIFDSLQLADPIESDESDE